MSKKPTASSLLYQTIVVTDMLSCANTLPVLYSYLNRRTPGLFGNYYYRQVWGLTWEPLPYFSVFLVLVLSAVRTVGLARPLGGVSRGTVGKVVLGYLGFLVGRFTAGVVFFGRYTYNLCSKPHGGPFARQSCLQLSL